MDAPAFIPLMFRPGEAYQFDWSHEDVEIAGKPMRVKVAHVRLCASRTMFVRAYPCETQEMLFDAHARATEDPSVLKGILCRLRCGAPWRDVSEKYGKWNTIYRRFRRGSETGELGDRVGHSGRNDGGYRLLQHRQYHHPRPRLGSDGKRAPHQQALGRSRGGFGCKVHYIADAGGRPLAFHLTGGQAADCKAYDTLIALPGVEPAALLDKGSDADAIRDNLRGRRIDAVISGRSSRKKPIIHDRILYRERNRIERMSGHLGINRAVAIRYEQLAESFLSMIQIAATRYLLKSVHAA